jgi:hypothetical protein
LGLVVHDECPPSFGLGVRLGPQGDSLVIFTRAGWNLELPVFACDVGAGGAPLG